MSDALNALVDLLALEPLEENLFRGRSQDLGLPQLFGGRCSAKPSRPPPIPWMPNAACTPCTATSCVPAMPDAGGLSVDAVRDGASFTTRRITAIQKGRPIFFCSASFHGEETSITHQPRMPEVAPPDAPENDDTRVTRFPGHPIEFRHLEDSAEPGQPARKRLWFRLAGELPDDPALHRYLLAYSSDFNLLTTSLVPHDITFGDPRLQIASLDHALWFHHDVKVNDWLLYDMDSPWAGGARGFSRGSIYDRDGRLVASSAQEGLTRLRDTPR